MLALPASSADAGQSSSRHAQTCKGQEPTAVTIESEHSETGPYVMGTEGDDVILVTTDLPDQLTVNGRGGDDLICVRGLRSVSISAGLGEDYVEILGPSRDKGGENNYYIHDGENLKLDLRKAPSWVYLVSLGDGTGSIVGGTAPNRTNLRVEYVASVRANLEKQVLKAGGGRYKVRNVKGITAHVADVVLTGDQYANRFMVPRSTCTAVLRGGSGNDTMVAQGGRPGLNLRGDSDPFDCVRGASGQAHTRLIEGQLGDDALGGSKWNDVIVGGPGRDRANAGSGRDTCRQVEVVLQRSCEK